MENNLVGVSSKILTIIPARAGSKRIPNKNRKKLAGKELIRYSIEACLNAKALKSIIVSSDDKKTIEIANEYPDVIAIERPTEISGDHAPAISYVLHALSYMKESYNFDYDMVVIVQPSSPFTLGEDIDKTITLLVENDMADSSVSVVKLDHVIHPLKLKTLKNNELKPYLEEENGRMADYELPELYVRNGSVYVSKIKNILNNKIIGDNCLGYVMPRDRSIDINDPIDFKFAEFLIKNKIE